MLSLIWFLHPMLVFEAERGATAQHHSPVHQRHYLFQHLSGDNRL